MYLLLGVDMDVSSSHWIEKLNLQHHPEGGWFAETYRAEETLAREALPERYNGKRSIATAIYFLLTTDEFSALHRIQSDEIWHFYTGGPAVVVTIDGDGQRKDIRIGNNPERGESFQAVIPTGTWFGAYVDEPNSFVLVGCTVAPGFDFADFELAERGTLLRLFPQHEDIIRRLTR